MTDKTLILKQIIGLLQLKGIGPGFFSKNVDFLRSAFEQGLPSNEILQFISPDKFSKREILSSSSQASEIVDIALEQRIEIRTFLDSNFPHKINSQKFRFPILSIIGKPDFSNSAIGIIGTREPSLVGTQITQRISTYFGKLGYNLISGLAQGVDGEVFNNQANLERIIGIAPGGLAIPIDKSLSGVYRRNATRVLENGGAIVSPFIPFTKQDNYKLISYCELQAALADGIFLVQSTIDGGSKYTLKTFSTFKRPLGIVNPALHDSEYQKYSGNLLIINDKKEGLSKMASIPLKKINCNVLIISSKDDYTDYVKHLNDKNL